jgi:hypothetical protein
MYSPQRPNQRTSSPNRHEWRATTSSPNYKRKSPLITDRTINMTLEEYISSRKKQKTNSNSPNRNNASLSSRSPVRNNTLLPSRSPICHNVSSPNRDNNVSLPTRSPNRNNKAFIPSRSPNRNNNNTSAPNRAPLSKINTSSPKRPSLYHNNIVETPRPSTIKNEQKIRVCIRKRPLSKTEILQNEQDIASIASSKTVEIHAPKYALLLQPKLYDININLLL